MGSLVFKKYTLDGYRVNSGDFCENHVTVAIREMGGESRLPVLVMNNNNRERLYRWFVDRKEFAVSEQLQCESPHFKHFKVIIDDLEHDEIVWLYDFATRKCCLIDGLN